MMPTTSYWLHGARLFRAGQFFAAHEEWEIQWKNESGAPKLLLQGWILLSGVGVKLEQRQLDPASRLALRARERWMEYRGRLPTGEREWLDLPELTRALAWIEEFLAALAGSSHLSEAELQALTDRLKNVLDESCRS